MPVRNFWIEANIDGRKTELRGGPQNLEGGFDLTVYMRDEGGISKALTLSGSSKWHLGKLELMVDTEYDIEFACPTPAHPNVLRGMTLRDPEPPPKRYYRVMQVDNSGALPVEAPLFYKTKQRAYEVVRREKDFVLSHYYTVKGNLRRDNYYLVCDLETEEVVGGIVIDEVRLTQAEIQKFQYDGRLFNV